MYRNKKYTFSFTFQAFIEDNDSFLTVILTLPPSIILYDFTIYITPKYPKSHDSLFPLC